MALTSVPPGVPGSKPKKLLDQTRDVLRVKHYSLRTERSYCDWIKRFIYFHQLRHPKEMGAAEISTFLTHLARIGNVSAATQNQHVKLRLRAGSGYKNSGMFYVYVLRSKADSGFYIGYTNNLRIGLKEHRAGRSFATAHRGPWKLVYYEAYIEHADALGRERYLKSGAGRRFLKAQLRDYLATNPIKSPFVLTAESKLTASRCSRTHQTA